MSARGTFVKSGTTSTPVASSKAAIEKMLVRYGASAFQVTQDYQAFRATVSFSLPNTTAGDCAMVPVRIPVEILKVATALYGPLRKDQHYTKSAMEQSERVAWRNLVLWIDAALSAATIGLQTITEAFFAHALVNGERVIDLAESGRPIYKQLASGPR
jgi:hypothetical protein